MEAVSGSTGWCSLLESQVKVTSRVVGYDEYWSCRQWHPLELQMWSCVWWRIFVP